MKQRLLNRCKNCGHKWFPRGFDISRKCPNCGGVDVDLTGRFYLAILVGLTVCAGVFWATDRPHRAARNATPPPAARPGHMKRGIAAQGDSTDPLSIPQITTEAEGRAEALRLFPDLGVANSPLNREFVSRYRSYQRLQPEFFQNPAWPVILVKECAAVLGERSNVVGAE